VLKRFCLLAACVIAIGVQAAYARDYLRGTKLGIDGAHWDVVSVTEYSPCDVTADGLAMAAAMNQEPGVLGPAW
jgi:hypothetical protein